MQPNRRIISDVQDLKTVFFVLSELDWFWGNILLCIRTSGDVIIVMLGKIPGH